VMFFLEIGVPSAVDSSSFWGYLRYDEIYVLSKTSMLAASVKWCPFKTTVCSEGAGHAFTAAIRVSIDTSAQWRFQG